MKLTRPQRVSLAWTLFVVGAVVVLWMIWSQRLHAYTATATTPPSSTIVREFGRIQYLTITTRQQGVLFGATQPVVLSRDWNWRGRAMAINALVSAAALGLLGVACVRIVRKDRLVGRCDECGYDLTGLRSETCPECGTHIVRETE